MDIHQGQERVTVEDFEYDGIWFPTGTEFTVAVFQQEDGTWRCGCAFYNEHHEMHELQYVDQELNEVVRGCDPSHGWWIYYSTILEHTIPLIPVDNPSWEV